MQYAAVALVSLVLVQPASGVLDPGTGFPGVREPSVPRAEIVWRRSAALGTPAAGRLVRGVRFPGQGGAFFTWDPLLHRIPNRAARRWGTDRLIRLLLRVVAEHAAAHPGPPRVGIGDLSLRDGGRFGPVHATHQNGLDADVYYPRRDGKERPPARVSQIDLRLAQDLVDRFVAAGAELVYVGPNTPLRGPPGVVRALWNHDNHLHVRIRGTTR